jgi:hypothetical protein
MADWTGAGFATDARYREMAEFGYADASPSYRRLAFAVASDPAVLAHLDTLPPLQRQPNLLFAAARYLGGPVGEPGAFLEWRDTNWPAVREVVTTRRTQTNEARRCATVLPALAAVPGPLALVEVGASAGLCLLPDRYAYHYTGAGVDETVGRSTLTLSCEVTGPVPVPEVLPEVVWRRGLDLHPLDVTSDDDVRWLQCLVWPEQTDRFEILRDAIAIAREDPPVVVEGDLLVDLAGLVQSAPVDATVVVYHSAVLAYLGESGRSAFVESLARLGREVVWVSNEAPGVVVEYPRVQGRFVLGVDGRPVALTGQHGHTLDWL